MMTPCGERGVKDVRRKEWRREEAKASDETGLVVGGEGKAAGTRKGALLGKEQTS